jgi:small subunit ribosomal protein S7e
MAALRKIVKPKGAAEPDEFEQSVSNALLELENGSDFKAELHPLHITAAKEVDAGHGKRAVLVFVPVPQLKSYHKIANKLIRELEKKFAGKHVILVGQRRILKKPSRTRSAKQPRPRCVVVPGGSGAAPQPQTAHACAYTVVYVIVVVVLHRSRTLTAVHEAILEDLVFPSEIVGKRTRVKTDGEKLTKVYVRAGTPPSHHPAGRPARSRANALLYGRSFLDRKDQTALEHKLDTFSSVYKTLTGKDVVFEFPAAPTLE